MKTSEMTNLHIQNRINWLRKMLSKKPDQQYYSGDSDMAGDCVEMENLQNDRIAEEIEEQIAELQIELDNRLNPKE